MDQQFEGVFINDGHHRSEHKLLDMERLKIGEVFQIRHNHFAFACTHCSQEFQSFQRLAAHISTHFNNAMHWMTPSGSMDGTGRAHDHISGQSTDESVEWLFSDSSDDDLNDRSHESIHQMDVECDVQLHEDYSHTPNYEADNGKHLTESPFKVKHPLMRVKDTAETKRIRPYFTKKFQFERTINQMFKCPFCEYVAPAKSSVREHIFSHTQDRLFVCKICDYDFDRPRELYEHLDEVHKEVSILLPQKRIAIEQLDKMGNVRESNILVAPNIKIEPRISLTPPNVKSEPRFDANGERIRAQCYICNKTFSRPNGYMKHLKVHTQEKNYTCITCGAQFRRSDHLSRHQLIHEAPKFKCDVCEMTFRRSDKLLEHRRKHVETMNFTCENCGLGFMELASIKTHVSFHCKGKLDGLVSAAMLAQSIAPSSSTTTTTTTELTISSATNDRRSIPSNDGQSQPHSLAMSQPQLLNMPPPQLQSHQQPQPHIQAPGPSN